MKPKDKIEFRRLLAAYIEHCNRKGFEEHVVIAGMVMMEAWIDQLIDKEVLLAVGPGIKMKVSHRTNPK
jgi:hypothetical protein